MNILGFKKYDPQLVRDIIRELEPLKNLEYNYSNLGRTICGRCGHICHLCMFSSYNNEEDLGCHQVLTDFSGTFPRYKTLYKLKKFDREFRNIKRIKSGGKNV